MGMAEAIKEGKMSASKSPVAAKIAKTMKPGDLKDFASTTRKGLPVHSVGSKVKKLKRSY
jgi:hypothetical protein